MIKTRGELQDKKLHLLRRKLRYRQRYYSGKNAALDWIWKKQQKAQQLLG